MQKSLIINYTQGAYMYYYHIKNINGYWLVGGGYTTDYSQAGWFSLDDMKAYNLDGCTLYRVK